jgi:hypothetical protein
MANMIHKILIVSVLFSLVLTSIITANAQTDRQVNSHSFVALSNASKASASPQKDVRTFSAAPQTIVSAPSSNSVVSPSIGSYSYTVTNATSSFARETISGIEIDILNPPTTSPIDASSKQVVRGDIIK